jgi:3-hydroxyacyl-[acyl-carrier-protein] dehydratase
MLSYADIARLLPHRFPMLLVDRVVSLQPGASIVGLKHVTASDACFAGLDAASDAAMTYPWCLVIESFGQTAGVLANWGRDRKPGGEVMLLAKVGRCRFEQVDVGPGDTLENHVRLTRTVGDVVILEGEVRAAGRTIARIDDVIMTFAPHDGPPDGT